MADRVLQVRFVGDTDNLGRSIRHVSEEFAALSRVGDNASATLGKFSKAMAISSVAAAAAVGTHGLTSAVVGLGAAVVASTGSLLLLPGAALAGGVAFGALKIGISGFGDAMKSIGDPEKFAEAIKGLAPAAQEAARAVAGLKPRFEELRLAVQERLFAGLGERISQLGNTFLPILQGSFTRITGAANGAMHAVAGMLLESSRVRDVSSIGDAAASSFGNLMAAVRPLVGAFLDVATVGANMLPGLTSGAGAAAQRFADMVASMRESGRLQEIIQGGLDALRQLGQLVVNVGSIIGTVFSAMNTAGGGILNTMVSLTGEVRAFLKSAEGQSALTAVFSALNGFVQALLPGVRAIGSALISVIQSIAPALPGLGAAFSAIASSVAPLVRDLGTLAGVVLPPLIAAITFLGPALGPLAAFIGGVVLAVKAWSAVQWVLNAALSANPIGIVIVAIGALIAILALAWAHSETFRDIVTGAWEVIKTVSSAVWGAVVGTIRWAIDTVRGILGWFSGLPGMFRGWWDGAVNATGDAINGLVRWVADLPGRILGALGNLGKLLWNSGIALVSGFWDGIVSRWNQMVDWVRRGMANLRALWPFSPAKEGPFSGRGYVTHSGAALTSDFAASIRKGMPGVASAVRDVLGVAQGGFSVADAVPISRASSGGAGTPSAAGPREVAMKFVGDADQAVATMIMQLIRSGKIQLTA